MRSSICLVLFFLLASLEHTLALGNVLSLCLQEDDDPNPCEVEDIWKACKDPPASDDGWACTTKGIDFPIVECLLEDMKRCGNIGVNSVFHPFGAATPQTRLGLRDKLVSQRTMYNDILLDSVSNEKKVHERSRIYANGHNFTRDSTSWPYQIASQPSISPDTCPH